MKKQGKKPKSWWRRSKHTRKLRRSDVRPSTRSSSVAPGHPDIKSDNPLEEVATSVAISLNPDILAWSPDIRPLEIVPRSSLHKPELAQHQRPGVRPPTKMLDVSPDSLAINPDVRPLRACKLGHEAMYPSFTPRLYTRYHGLLLGLAKYIPRP